MAAVIKSELPKLASALVQYQALSKKTWGDIMAKEAREWAFELFKAFSALSPTPGAIGGAAVARGMTMGRKGNSLTGAIGGVSAAARERAITLMEGARSDFFKVGDHEGIPQLRRARFSKFVRGGERRLLIGGRFGNKFAAGSLRSYQVEQEHLAAAQAKNQNLKRLNLRAVSVAVELGYRARAAKGHLMGNQWLPAVYKGRKNALLKTGPLLSRSTNGSQLGRIDFTLGPDGEPVGVTLSAFVPGTERQASAHGIAAAVEAIRVSDRLAYVQRKIVEDAASAFKK